MVVVQGGSGLGAEAAQQHVTRILIGAREDIKFSPRAIILLIGLQIVDIKQLDEYLAKVEPSTLTLLLPNIYSGAPLLGTPEMRIPL